MLLIVFGCDILGAIVDVHLLCCNICMYVFIELLL